MHFLIIHGTMGSPEGNWFPWLKAELESRGHTVSVPAFPTPDGQCLDAWMQVATVSLQGIDPAKTILVGHSIGPALMLHMAARTQVPYRAIFAVCPFLRQIGNPEYDTLNASFILPDLDWRKVTMGAKLFVFFASDNDPYVPLSYAQEVAAHCSSELRLIPGGGHLNAEFGYTRFDVLLNSIEDIL